jgi:hypothetical protein
VPIEYTSVVPATGLNENDWLALELHVDWVSCSALVPAPPGTVAQLLFAWLTIVLEKATAAWATGAVGATVTTPAASTVAVSHRNGFHRTVRIIEALTSL